VLPAAAGCPGGWLTPAVARPVEVAERLADEEAARMRSRQREQPHGRSAGAGPVGDVHPPGPGDEAEL